MRDKDHESFRRIAKQFLSRDHNATGCRFRMGTRTRVVHAVAHMRREFFTISLSGVVRPKILSS